MPKATPKAEDAWKVLSIPNKWLRHADAKTGATLAFVGATSALLFNLVDGHQLWTRLLIVTVSLASVALATSVACAVARLFARTKRRQPRRGQADSISHEDTVNLLFFGDVYKHYAEDRHTYRQVLSLLSADQERLIGQIADQVHANARIATVKFQWTNRAILAEFIAAAATAVAALLTATNW